MCNFVLRDIGAGVFDMGDAMNEREKALRLAKEAGFTFDRCDPPCMEAMTADVVRLIALARQQQDRAPQGENDPHAPDCPMYGRSYVSPCTCGAPSASIDAAQPAQREGWVLVPKEPTDAMIASAREHHEGEAYLPVSLYRAMLAAAPSPTGEKG